MGRVRFRRNDGFTIIEMLMMFGILTICVGAISSAIFSSMKALKNVSIDREIEDSLSFLRQVIKDSGNCTPNLATQTFDSAAIGTSTPPVVTITQLANSAGTVLLQNGTTLKDSPTVMVQSITMTDLIQVTAFTKYVGNVRIELLKPEGKILGPALSVKKIPITLNTSQVGATNVVRINSCSLGDSLPQESLPKAWAVFQGGHPSGPACGPSCTIVASYNVASVVRVAPGEYTVTFINPMPDGEYAVVFGGPGIIWGGTYDTPLGVGHDNNPMVTNTPTTFKIITALSGALGNNVDAGAVSFAVFHE